MILQSEVELRQKIVEEAQTWIGTPYVSNGMVKGRNGGGTDCAMLLVGVYGELGLIPKEFDPRPYPPHWHVHRDEEKYINYILPFVHEVDSPPIRKPLPGDVVMFKIGRVFAHGAIIINWPKVIHAVGNAMVTMDDISKMTVGKRALALVPQRFFSLWS